MKLTHLDAMKIFETGDEQAAWELAQQDDGLLPDATKDQWIAFARRTLERRELNRNS